jgi:hypothetical protein
MTPDTMSRPLRDTGWILAGALLGSSICFVVAGGSLHVDTGGAASFASFALSALILSTLGDRAELLPASRLLNAQA